MPKQLPYMKWYPADFEDDPDIKLMTYEERGVLITLLNHAWMNDGIKNDFDELARRLYLADADFQRIWKRVGKAFYLNNHDRWINKKQEAERKYAREKSLVASASAAYRHDRKAPGFVYFIVRSSDRAVKIGTTSQVPKRLAALQSEYRRDLLELMCQRAVESMGDEELRLHSMFGNKRVVGEWFLLSEEDIKFAFAERAEPEVLL